MFPSITKALMVLLLCLIFVGQVMATSLMPYQMMNTVDTQAQAHDMAMMAHSSDQMVSDVDNLTMDCYENDCACFIGGCSTVALLTNIIDTELVVTATEKIKSIASLALSQQLTSLYRPPILS